MKQSSILRNPYFYVSALLFGLLVFQIASIVRAQSGGGVWGPPEKSPPFGLPAAPLDTSSAEQTKAGELWLRGDEGLKVGKTGGKTVQILTTNPQINFTDANKTGSIRFNVGNGKVEVKHNNEDFVPIGSGTGGGFWQSEQGGRIHYDGRVGVGTGEQSLVSMLHVKASSAVNSATQGLTIQGPQATFQSRYSARLFMQGTDFRILRTTNDVDDGLTIRANGDVVAGRNLQVKGNVTIDGDLKVVGDRRFIILGMGMQQARFARDAEVGVSCKHERGVMQEEEYVADDFTSGKCVCNEGEVYPPSNYGGYKGLVLCL